MTSACISGYAHLIQGYARFWDEQLNFVREHSMPQVFIDIGLWKKNIQIYGPLCWNFNSEHQGKA